ncbi:MAG: phospho-N-acetylmuramoyl-pentapeptide-transferase [Symbiobacterium sp.]|uniref:phospho-N-acetylmuramoyl-pentapeptide- transferase n=1 Tax=Symbiobacterium sp. TaxID=1971213 RepID=UPI003464330E
MFNATLLRLAGAGVLALIGALALGPAVIPLMRRLKFGQTIRAEMSAHHQAKAGTPTMGGVIFAIPAILATLIFAPRTGDALPRLIIALVLTVGHGLVGFADDYIKVVLKRSLGLRARDKLLAQVFLAAVLGYGAVEVLGLGTAVTLPYLDVSIELGKPLYYVLVLFIVWGTANAVNFADGLDGLLGGLSVITFTFYGLFVALALGQTDLAVLSIALVGGCLGFLYYNHYPARIFMGDVGSFTLGGALAALAVLTKTEFLLVVVGGVYVIEVISVILQVASFRLTGKRIFRMAPLHHHFELLGWSEWQVLLLFWGVSLVLTVLGWLALPGMLGGR